MSLYVAICRDGPRLYTMEVPCDLEAIVETMTGRHDIMTVYHLEGDRCWNENEKAAMLWLERNPHVDPAKSKVPAFVQEHAKDILEQITRDIAADMRQPAT